MLANNRTGKLIARKIYDTNSIGTNKGTNAKLAPPGNNKLKKLILCFFIPIKLKFYL
jgi:hypothetical protein